MLGCVPTAVPWAWIYVARTMRECHAFVRLFFFLKDWLSRVEMGVVCLRCQCACNVLTIRSAVCPSHNSGRCG